MRSRGHGAPTRSGGHRRGARRAAGGPQSPEPARRQRRAPGRSRAVVVATGQQAGAFGGPIFTLLKALTAIKLARAVEASHGVPAVPVFWVDAEDHDWNEVAGCTVLDAELTPKTVGVGAAPRTGSCPIHPAVDARRRRRRPRRPARGPPAHRVHRHADRLARPPLRRWRDPGARLRRRDGRSARSARPRRLRRLGSGDEAPRRAAVRARAVAPRGRRRAWPPPPAPRSTPAATRRRSPPPPTAPRCSRSARRASRSSARRTASPSGMRQVSDAEPSSREATAHPERFSPNVLLRPLVQDTLFPTAPTSAAPARSPTSPS